ncbi:MAG: tetratricopeptide repeat protein [Thermoplasmatota archaeon]
MNEDQFLRAMERGDMEEAQRILGGLRSKLPRTRLLYFEGMVLDGIGEPEEALKKFNMALVLHLSDPSIWLAKARVLQELGKMDMARRAVDRACRLSSGNSSAHLLHAEILYKMKDHRGAMTQINEAIDLAPEDPEILTLKGILVSIIEEDYRKALGFFDKALTSDENHAPAWTNRGVALRMIGDRDGSIYSFQKALLLDSEDKTAIEMLTHMGAEKYIVPTQRTMKEKRRSRRTMHLIDEAPRGRERKGPVRDPDENEDVRRTHERKVDIPYLDDDEDEDLETLSEGVDEDWDEEEELEDLEEELEDLEPEEEDHAKTLEPIIGSAPAEASEGSEDWDGEEEEEPEELEDEEEEEEEQEDEDEEEELKEKPRSAPILVPPAPSRSEKVVKKKKMKKGRDLDLDCPRCGRSFQITVKGLTKFKCPSCGLSGQIE